MKMGVTVSTSVKRGPESWAYIYITLGFALSIEGSVVQMVTPIVFPWNVILYVAVSAATFWLFVENARFQNWLIGLKSRYEEKSR